jgi:LacI family transcriptional regulator
MFFMGGVSMVRRAGITDVAKHAHVSIGTVSNVLNKLSTVDPIIKKRVEESIAELGYIRNRGAASIRSNSNPVYGLIVHDVTNPAYSEIASGAKRKAAESGYNLLVASSGESTSAELENLKLFEELRLAGIVLATISEENVNYAQQIQARGTPVVIIGTQDVPGIPHVTFSDKMGGALAMEHLLSLFHENIYFMAGSLKIQALQDRLTGIKSVIPKKSTVTVTYFETDSQSLKGGIAAAKAIEKMPAKSRPTGIIAGNDLIAVGIQQTLLHGKVMNSSQRISVVGYDDIGIAELDTISLTTVRQDFNTIGKKSVELLIAMKSSVGKIDSKKLSINLVPELIVRQSSFSVKA